MRGRMNVPPLSGMTPIFANDWMNVALGRREDDVAREGEVGAGAGGDAVHRADDRLLERANRADDRVVAVAHEVAEVGHHAVLRRRLGQVLAGAEAAAGAGQQHGANRRGPRRRGRAPRSIAAPWAA